MSIKILIEIWETSIYELSNMLWCVFLLIVIHKSLFAKKSYPITKLFHKILMIFLLLKSITYLLATVNKDIELLTQFSLKSFYKKCVMLNLV